MNSLQERLIECLRCIEAQAQRGLDGTGRGPWSQAHLLTILAELRDLAGDGLEDAYLEPREVLEADLLLEEGDKR